MCVCVCVRVCVCVQSKFDHLEISLDSRSKSYYNVVRNRFFAPENRIEPIFSYTTILCYPVSFFFSCPLSKVDSYIIDDGCNPMIRWVYNARPQRMLTRCVLLLSPFSFCVSGVPHSLTKDSSYTHE